jgi:hypothetical protein
MRVATAWMSMVYWSPYARCRRPENHRSATRDVWGKNRGRGTVNIGDETSTRYSNTVTKVLRIPPVLRTYTFLVAYVLRPMSVSIDVDTFIH